MPKIENGNETENILVDDLEGATELTIEGLGFETGGHVQEKMREIEGGCEGILSAPRRFRVCIACKRNEHENAKEELYSWLL
ncbi:hypothetical protein RJ641_034752 [Dillenia turbinata]|uniref:Uncharacterized protein n=1 Tax=Dillenia turbinata TaxID=194707 RepID=A0AAN8VRW6_9MAGN